MVDLPWGTDSVESADTLGSHGTAVVACEFQDGLIAVYEDEVVIERVPRSKFADKVIPVAAISGVEYSGGITVGYLQIEQAGVEADTGGLLSDPVNENTLHFTRSGRACAETARDAISEHAQLPPR